MDFDDTPEEAAFRARARAFLDSLLERRLPGERRPGLGADDPRERERSIAYQARLFDDGFACLSWPREYGGQEARPIFQVIWNQEEARYRTPPSLFAIQHGNLGPTLIHWGTAAQKSAYLRRMARGDDVWCQLFSEPGAGSDLAGLRTRAVRDGSDWVVTGQKIWTSNAHHARYGMLVARTDPSVPKHAGLTYFVIDMHAPGVRVNPIRTMAGTSHFCEVFFDAARVPDRDRIGGVGEGWRVSVTTLMNERTLAGGYGTPSIPELIELARSIPRGADRSALADSSVRARIADFWAAGRGVELALRRAHTALSRGRDPGPENSIVKLVAAKLGQDLHAFATDLASEAGALLDAPESRAAAYLDAPGGRLAGGTDEILRNILAERVLGLPGEIRLDKGIAFDQIPGARATT
jgi:alkylation response protein AidB-like acyl-CoA dehydrogenase